MVTPEIERFIEALLLLTDPEHAMMDWVKGEVGHVKPLFFPRSVIVCMSAEGMSSLDSWPL